MRVTGFNERFLFDTHGASLRTTRLITIIVRHQVWSQMYGRCQNLPFAGGRGTTAKQLKILIPLAFRRPVKRERPPTTFAVGCALDRPTRRTTPRRSSIFPRMLSWALYTTDVAPYCRRLSASSISVSLISCSSSLVAHTRWQCLSPPGRPLEGAQSTGPPTAPAGRRRVALTYRARRHLGHRRHPQSSSVIDSLFA